MRIKECQHIGQRPGEPEQHDMFVPWKCFCFCLVIYFLGIFFFLGGLTYFRKRKTVCFHLQRNRGQSREDVTIETLRDLAERNFFFNGGSRHRINLNSRLAAEITVKPEYWDTEDPGLKDS